MNRCWSQPLNSVAWDSDVITYFNASVLNCSFWSAFYHLGLLLIICLLTPMLTFPARYCCGFDYCYCFSVSELSDFLLSNYSNSFSCYDTVHGPIPKPYSAFQTFAQDPGLCLNCISKWYSDYDWNSFYIFQIVL